MPACHLCHAGVGLTLLQYRLLHCLAGISARHALAAIVLEAGGNTGCPIKKGYVVAGQLGIIIHLKIVVIDTKGSLVQAI